MTTPKSSTILIVTDDNFLPHAKSLMVNCVRQGSWQGDLCLMCPQNCDVSSLQGRGILIRKCPESRWTNAVKFRIFDPWFKQWSRLLYLDCDVIVQRDLNDACEAMSIRFPKILCDSSHTAHVTIRKDWEHFDALSGTGPEAHPEVYERLKAQFPFIDEGILASSVMFFDPSTVPPGTVEQLNSVQESYKEANPGSYDQQVINLVLHDQLAPMEKDYCSWWAFDDVGSRVASTARGWRGDEFPVIIHYWNMYAPWKVKTPDAGAYANERLGRVCHELYAENLAKFEETFPQKG